MNSRNAPLRNSLLALCAFAVVVTGAVSTGSRQADAATFTVTSLSDDGSTGTLRWAITQANATAGTDVISFDNAVTGTITLTSNLPSITDSVTINGPGEDDLVIDGVNAYRPFWIATQGKVLTLTDMTLRRGGGGGDSQLIFNSKAVISATRVTFRDTTGRAVFNKEAFSVATYMDCSFIDNGQGIGGDHGSTPSAVSNTDTDYQNRTYVIDSLFEGNSTAIGQERWTKVTNSVFRDNVTAASIRGLNRTQIYNSTFTGNTVAVYHNNWTPTTWTSVGTNNRLHDGNVFEDNAVTFQLYDSWNNGQQSQQWTTITNNTWDGSGTWIQAGRWNGSANVTDTVTSLNSAGRVWVESGNTLVTPTTTAPPTTTTTAPPSTTTTAPPATTVPPGTTVAPGATVPAAENAPVQQANGASTNTAPAARATATTAAPAATTTTTTTTTTIPAPEAPDTSASGAGATVDGEEVETTLTRSNNALVVSGAGIEASVYGMSTDGARIDLDEDGLLRLSDEDRIVVEASGYEAGESVDVWMYSTPMRLGSLTVDQSGAIAGSFVIPSSIESGDHRVVLEGTNKRGQDVVLGIGVAFGEVQASSLISRLLIIVPVSLAILAALIIPTTLRRRREDNATA